jgi:hypothetical protein
MSDDVVLIDGYVDLRRPEVGVAEQLRRDVHGQSAGDSFGGPDPTEVVRGVVHWLAVWPDQLRAFDGELEQTVDGGGAHHAHLSAVASLEQVGQWSAGHPFVMVVAGHQRDLLLAATDAMHHSGEYVGQFWGDQQEPFVVQLGRCDLQQRHDLARVGQGVGDQRKVGQFEQLFVPDAGMAQSLDDRPAPERFILGPRHVDVFVGREPPDTDTAGAALSALAQVGLGNDALELFAVDIEGVAAGRCAGGGEQTLGVVEVFLDAVEHCGQQGGEQPGALVYARATLALLLHAAAHVGVPDWAADRPRGPGRIFQRPLGDIEVEGAHGEQHAVVVQARLALAAPPLQSRALLPGRRDVGREVQRADARMVFLEVLPEGVSEQCDEPAQRGVVQLRGSLGEVADQQVAYRPAGQLIVVDELGNAALPSATRCPERRCRPREHVGLAQHLPGQAQRVRVAARCAQPDVVLEHVGGSQLPGSTTGVCDHPCEVVERIHADALTVPASLKGRCRVGEEGRIDGGAHEGVGVREVAADQPVVARSQHAKTQQATDAGGCVASGSEARERHRQRGQMLDEVVAPESTVGLHTAGLPALLPGLAGPGLQPTEDQPGAPAPTGALVAIVLPERQVTGEVGQRGTAQPRLRPIPHGRLGRPAARGRLRRRSLQVLVDVSQSDYCPDPRCQPNSSPRSAAS